MPRSQFLGGDGVWSEEDRAYALAWQQYAGSLCTGCGHDLADTTSPRNQHQYGGEVVRCHACAAQSRTVQKFVDDGGDKSGIMFRFTEMPDKKT